MPIEADVFKRSNVCFDRLEAYGFQKTQDKWVYRKNFFNDAFCAVITIDEKGHISGLVWDTACDDVYLALNLKNAQTPYVLKVQAQYQKILEDIRGHCFLQKYFISEQTNRLCDMIFKNYGDKPDFPWEKYEGFGVFKNPDNKKWYALIMPLKYEKLDTQKSGDVEIINIKLDPDEIKGLLERNGFYPAYHMNKKNWITITLDDTLSDDELLSLVDKSHAFTLKKARKIDSK